MLLDFDPDVAGIASQSFWLRWLDESGTASQDDEGAIARFTLN